MKYLKDELSESERLELEGWLVTSSNRLLFDQITSEQWIRQELVRFREYSLVASEDIKRIQTAILNNRSTVRIPKVLAKLRFMVAVAAIIVLSVGSYFFFRPGTNMGLAENSGKSVQILLLPGKDTATLTLENGYKIDLDGRRNGVIARSKTTTIIKKRGQIIYKPHEKSANEGWLIRGPEDSILISKLLSYNDTVVAAVQIPYRPDSLYGSYNTVSTPKGGIYNLRLPDGSQVWLNAASSIRFPILFDSDRKVIITGEAFFEVAHGDRVFEVSANGIDIRAIGTSFNINAYYDEPDITVTLFEGALAIKNAKYFLKGKSQLKIVNGEVKSVEEVNTDSVSGWKNGFFVFENTTIEAILRQVSRWYDVNFLYEAKLSKKLIVGRIPRSAPLEAMLHALELSGDLSFKIEGRTVIVSDK